MNYTDPTGFSTPCQLVYLNPHNDTERRLAAMIRHDVELGCNSPMEYSLQSLRDAEHEVEEELGADKPTFSGPTDLEGSHYKFSTIGGRVYVSLLDQNTIDMLLEAEEITEEEAKDMDYILDKISVWEEFWPDGK